MASETQNENSPLLVPLQRGERRALPPRRRSEGYRVVINDVTVFLHTGLYEDGNLGEIFLHVHRQGTLVNGLLDAWAVSVSKALQYGMPFEELIDSFAFRKFEPAGFVQDDEDIKMVDSICAWVVRRLAIDHFGRNDLKSGGAQEKS